VKHQMCYACQGMLEMGAPVSADIVDCLFEYYTFGSLTKEGEELNFEQFIVLVRDDLIAEKDLVESRN
jgi:hypothetical protein